MIVIVDGVVDTGNVHLKSRSLHTAVDRARNKTGIVKVKNVRLHSAEHLRTLLGVLKGLLIKERPEDDGGVVAVTANHYVNVIKNLIV